jgi:hypothetical protein
MRKTISSDYVFQPHPEEGYFQGWNFSFSNSDYQIFVTTVVSNLGPNSLNNGVSISIESKKTGSFFIAKEYGEKDLKAQKDKFFMQFRSSTIEEKNGTVILQIDADPVKLDLTYSSLFTGPTLSAFKHSLGGKNFVRADIPFSFSKVSGTMEFKGEKIPLEGTGGMEHILTNYEVYKYSYRWEITRSISSKGYRFFTGGYRGKENQFFRTIAVQDPKGQIILSGEIQKSEILEEKLDHHTGYKLPIKEKVFIDKNEECGFLIEYENQVGRINILDNISAMLRFFIKVFFANPYIVNSIVKIEPLCSGKIPKGTNWIGIKSDYLINIK